MTFSTPSKLVLKLDYNAEIIKSPQIVHVVVDY